MIYEVLWMRLLTDAFGSTSLATSLILTAFMGGMALGALLVQPLQQRLGHKPIQLYACLEIILGAYALLSPALLGLLDRGVPYLLGDQTPLIWAQLLRFGLVAGVLILPTACMGATLPLLVTVLAGPRQAGSSSALLYGINTLGAVTGALLAGFWLVACFGTSSSLIATAMLNMLLGLGIWALAARFPVPERWPEPEPESHQQISGSEVRILILMTCSGCAAMSLEVAWTRLLSVVFGTSTYAFSLLLASFLTGLALGSLGMRKWADRLEPLPWMASLLAIAACCSLITLSLINELPFFFSGLFVWFQSALGPALTPHVLALLIKSGLAFGMLLPAGVFFGSLLPLAMAQSARIRLVNSFLGRVYALNTLGSVCGALLSGWVLGPVLGFYRSIQWLAWAMLLLSVWICLTPAYKRFLLGLQPLLLLALGLCLWQKPYDPRPLFLEVFQYPDTMKVSQSQIEKDFLNRLQIRFAHDGLNASVALAQQGNNLMLLTDGKMDSGSNGELGVRTALAQLPLLLVPERKRVMVIGLGAGATAASVLSHPVQELQVIEIEQMVLDIYHQFFKGFFRSLVDPRVKIVIDDARTRVRQARDLDVMISQSSHPWRTGSSRLFTQDFWRDCRQALKPEGIFAQWLQLYGLDSDQFKSILASFQSVFRYVLVFRFGENTILLGSAEPLVINLHRVLDRLAEPLVQAELQHLPDPELHQARIGDLLVHLEAGNDELLDLVEEARINTEDKPYIEFAAAGTLLQNHTDQLTNLLEKNPPPFNTYLALEGLDPAQKQAVGVSLVEAAYKYRLQSRPGLLAELQRIFGAQVISGAAVGPKSSVSK